MLLTDGERDAVEQTRGAPAELWKAPKRPIPPNSEIAALESMLQRELSMRTKVG